MQEAVQQIFDKLCKEEGWPGIVFAAIDRKGNVLVESAAGVRSLEGGEPMTIDSIFNIWSCTKMVAGVACMQLVEQGKLALDEPVEEKLPEIGKVKLVDGSSPKTKITLRHLLSHTSGFGYTFFSEELNEWCKKSGVDEFDNKLEGVFDQPLIAEPGTRWNYGVGLDWAGRLLEKVTGMRLGEYCQKNIFEPLGITELGFGLKEDQKSRHVGSHRIRKDGKYESFKGPALAQPDCKPVFDSAGAGLSGTVKDYLKVVNILINDGVGADGARILKKETLDEMFKDQLSGKPLEDLTTGELPDVRPDLTNKVAPTPGVDANWGLTFQKFNKPFAMTGRGASSVWWAGLANLYWVADRENGIAHMIASQVLPFGDMKCLVPWLTAEGTILAMMAAGKKEEKPDTAEIEKKLESANL